jgi:hypothetical protein
MIWTQRKNRWTAEQTYIKAFITESRTMGYQRFDWEVICKKGKLTDKRGRYCPSLSEATEHAESAATELLRLHRTTFELQFDLYALHYLRPSETPPSVTPEFKFDESRQWRADFLIGDSLIVEIDGAVWSGGRHTRGQGFINDCIKLNRAMELGYAVLRYPTNLLDDDPSVVIEQVINTWRRTLK